MFYFGQLSHFPSCFGTGVTNLNESRSSFLLPPYYCGLGAGSIPLRAIVNKKQRETRGLFMSLVIHYWIGGVQDSQTPIFQIYTVTFKGTIYCAESAIKLQSIIYVVQKLVILLQYSVLNILPLLFVFVNE